MDSMVRGQDGQIVAIGGLMRQSSTNDRSQLPGAGDLPVVGALFRNTDQQTQKRELVVLIKPTIVDGAASWTQDMQDASGRIEKLDPRRPITPDTSFFFTSPHSQEALNTLLVAARSGEGFIKITGEVGTGKTLLCRKLLSELGSEACPVRLAWLPNPHLSPAELRTALALELGLSVREGNELDLTDRIHRHLIGLHQQGSRVVVLIDEAQA
eukprot:gene10215-12523_t